MDPDQLASNNDRREALETEFAISIASGLMGAYVMNKIPDEHIVRDSEATVKLTWQLAAQYVKAKHPELYHD